MGAAALSSINRNRLSASANTNMRTTGVWGISWPRMFSSQAQSIRSVRSMALAPAALSWLLRSRSLSWAVRPARWSARRKASPVKRGGRSCQRGLIRSTSTTVTALAHALAWSRDTHRPSRPRVWPGRVSRMNWDRLGTPGKPSFISRMPLPAICCSA